MDTQAIASFTLSAALIGLSYVAHTQFRHVQNLHGHSANKKSDVEVAREGLIKEQQGVAISQMQARVSDLQRLVRSTESQLSKIAKEAANRRQSHTNQDIASSFGPLVSASDEEAETEQVKALRARRQQALAEIGGINARLNQSVSAA